MALGFRPGFCVQSVGFRILALGLLQRGLNFRPRNMSRSAYTWDFGFRSEGKILGLAFQTFFRLRPFVSRVHNPKPKPTFFDFRPLALGLKFLRPKAKSDSIGFLFSGKIGTFEHES